MQRRRIGLDARECLDPRTGMGRYGLEVIRALLDADRHDWLIWLPPDAEVPVELSDRVAATVRSRARPYALREHITVAREIREAGLDGFHCLTYSLPLLAPRPLGLTLFDPVPRLLPAGYRWRARLYWRWLLPRLVARAARIMTLSRASRDNLVRLFGLAPSRFAVLPVGVSERFHRSPDPTPLRRLGVEPPYLLAVGNGRPHKNRPGLLAAFRRLRGARPELSLVLAGGDAAASPPTAGVVDLGRVDDRDLVALYSHAAVFVQPSLYEGAGLTPLEAMACGAPCVVSARGGLAELYGDVALVVEPEPEAIASAVARLLDRPEEVEGRRQAGRDLARRRPWRDVAAALTVELESMVVSARG